MPRREGNRLVSAYDKKLDQSCLRMNKSHGAATQKVDPGQVLLSELMLCVHSYFMRPSVFSSKLFSSGFAL